MRRALLPGICRRSDSFPSLLLAAALFACLSACAGPPALRPSFDDYRDRVHGGWLGQCIGNHFGIPYEFKYIETPGPEPAYDPGYARKCPERLYDGAFDDDDTLLEVLNASLVERHGFDITSDQIATGWTAYLKDGVYVANEQALALMRQGVRPPDTGNPRLNPYSPWNLSGQFTQEVWGLMAPGMPAEAQRLADRFARVPVYGESVLAAHFVSILYAEAFAEHDVEKLVRTAAGALPKGSTYRAMLDDVLAWHAEHPDDWRAVRAKVHAKYFGPPPAKWNANSCVINGAMCAIALLYGRGDFERTLLIACAAGDDADCNAATVAGVCGILCGAKGIPERWKAPLHDRYRIEHLNGFPKEMTISGFADRIADLGAKMILEHGGWWGMVGGRDLGTPTYIIPRRPPTPVALDPPVPPEPTTWPRTEWMHRGAYGVMVHYLISPPGNTPEEKTAAFNKTVEGFDLDGFMKQFESTGADWLIFTIGQNTGYYCSPNAFLDKGLPGHTSRRDLIAEVARRVHALGKRFIAYLPAEVSALPEGFQPLFKWDPADQAQFGRRYREFVRAYAERLGPRLDGWWFDGCYTSPPWNAQNWDWAAWGTAARAGNPDAIVAFNDGSFCVGRTGPVTPLEDYLAGEVHDLKEGKIKLGHAPDAKLHMPERRWVQGVQWHALLPLDCAFDGGAPRSYPDEELFGWVRGCRAAGGAVTINVIVSPGGHMLDKTVGQLQRMRATLFR